MTQDIDIRDRDLGESCYKLPTTRSLRKSIVAKITDIVKPQVKNELG